MWISFSVFSVGRTSCYFLLAQKVTKDAPRGVAPMNAFAERAFKVASPPGPPSTGTGNFGLLVNFGGLSFDRALFHSRPTGAFCHQNLWAYASILHRLVPAYLFGAAGVGWVDSLSPATDQLPQLCPSRRCPYNADAVKFHTGQGPVPPRQEGPAILILPAGQDCPRKQEGVPRKKGVWGQ